MKRFIIFPAVVLTICLALPQFSQAMNRNNEVVVTQQVEVKYTETTTDQLPKAVTDSLAKDYAGFKTDKAYKGDDGSFKVTVSKDTNKMVLYYSASGALIKSEKSA